MSDEYIRFHEHSDFVVSMELVHELLLRVKAEPEVWKWVLLAAHNGLQGAMVCTLHGTAGLGALSDDCFAKCHAWLEDRSEKRPPEPKRFLAKFPDLLKRIADQNWMSEFGGSAIVLNEDELWHLKLLNRLRREFTHYDPRGWSIQAIGLPRVVAVAVGVVKKLVQHPAIAIRMDAEVGKRLAAALAAIDAALVPLAPPAP